MNLSDPPSPDALLNAYGWDAERAVEFDEHALAARLPARVVADHGQAFELAGVPGGTVRAILPRGDGRAASRIRPAIGDWVAVTPPPGDGMGVVEAVLDRRSKLARKVAGEGSGEQVVAANVDVVLLVAGLGEDFNPRRLVRSVVAVADGGARPVILLNKADGRPDVLARVREAEEAAPGVPVLAISARTGEGIEDLGVYLRPGRTLVMLGSSGVGKSTLLNRLCGRDVLATGAVRESDEHGRHTTTHRQLVALPGGALLIDGPGVREFGLLAGEAALEESFGDVRSLAEACRFRDCAHEAEPGCAVLGAVDEGVLTSERLKAYRKLGREMVRAAARHDVHVRRAEQRRFKKVIRQHLAIKRERAGLG